MMATTAWRLALLGVLLVSTGLPFLTLVMTSLSHAWFWPDLVPPTLTLMHWRGLVDGSPTRLLPATLSSLGLAMATGALAVALAFPMGRAMARLRGWRRFLAAGCAFLPVAVPPLVLGVGLQFSFLRVGLGGTHLGVLLAHLIPAAGYVSLFLLGIFSVHDDRLEAEARTLGATPWQTLTRVTLPVFRRPLLEGFVLGFLVSWAQVPLTLLIGQGVVPALPLEVLSYLQAGQDARAATGALLLVAPPLLLMGAAGALLRGRSVVVA
jgi:putative spermidine/putrescine transport system permease protein